VKKIRQEHGRQHQMEQFAEQKDTGHSAVCHIEC